MNGKLYLVATPIGNLKDIALRSLDILKSVDLILVEDTRHSKTLLDKYDISTNIKSFHSFNETVAINSIIKLLEDGNNIALISDAGYPLISDPGSTLVKSVIKSNIALEVVPGVSAFLSALLLSGLDSTHFLFYGFLDKKKIRSELISLKNNPYTLIFYESKHRILKTLSLMLEVIGDRKIVLVREISKIYEEVIYTTLSEEISANRNYLGEFVLLIDGANTLVNHDEILLVERLKKSGLSRKDIIDNFKDILTLSNSEISDIFNKNSD